MSDSPTEKKVAEKKESLRLPSLEDVREWEGYRVDEVSGHSVARVEGFFVDQESGEPAWVLLKYVAYGLAKGQPPNFPAGPNKFIGIAERLIIATLVMFGQFLLVPLIALPRLIVEWPAMTGNRSHAAESISAVNMIELVASAILAVGVGLGLYLLRI